MPKFLFLPALAGGVLALSAMAATAAPTVRSPMQREGVSAALTKADWDGHCDWRCREHHRWEHERDEAHRRWEHRHEHY